MAINIRFKNESGIITTISWSIQDVWLPKEVQNNHLDNVLEISADEEDLVRIKNKFRAEIGNFSCQENYTIPMPIGRTRVRWFGDIAKTILANL